MSMNLTKIVSAFAMAICISAVSADVIVFENDNPAFTSILQSGVLAPEGPVLSINLDAYNQVEGPTSGPSLYIYYDEGSGSSPIGTWLATNSMTSIAHGEVQELWVPQWGTTEQIPGPLLREVGDQVDASLFGPLPTRFTRPALQFDGTSFIGDRSDFIIAVSMVIEDATHYGFVEFEVDGFNFVPVRWGYETQPGVSLIIPSAVCGDADINGDGELDFFDVSDFLDAFAAQDVSADLNGDNAFDFFDVSDFLDAFGAGCP